MNRRHFLSVVAGAVVAPRMQSVKVIPLAEEDTRVLAATFKAMNESKERWEALQETIKTKYLAEEKRRLARERNEEIRKIKAANPGTSTSAAMEEIDEDSYKINVEYSDDFKYLLPQRPLSGIIIGSHGTTWPIVRED